MFEGHVGYHCREGGHFVGEWDWARFIDFAERHLLSEAIVEATARAGAGPLRPAPPRSREEEEEANEAVVKSFLFGGNVDAFTEDGRLVNLLPDDMPYGGVYEGRAGVLKGCGATWGS